MNIDKLKGKILEKKKIYEECALALDIAVTIFSNKMNGKGKFYVDEINKLSKFLELSAEEKIDIFLN